MNRYTREANSTTTQVGSRGDLQVDNCVDMFVNLCTLFLKKPPYLLSSCKKMGRKREKETQLCFCPCNFYFLEWLYLFCSKFYLFFRV